MRPGIAFVASPCIRPRVARNATHTLFQQPVRALSSATSAAEQSECAETAGRTAPFSGYPGTRRHKRSHHRKQRMPGTAMRFPRRKSATESGSVATR